MAKDDLVPQAPQIPRRDKWVPLPKEYPGFYVKIWVNAPNELWTDINGTDGKRVEEALRKIILEHNGWLDFEGKPYPSADDPQFWVAIPTELAGVAITVCRLEASKLPNSLVPTRKR